MGEVYKVVDDEGRTFALKRLIRELVSDEGLARLRREASAASALEHPNIVKFVTLMEHEGAPHIVMEYLEGHTLKHVSRGSAGSTSKTRFTWRSRWPRRSLVPTRKGSCTET